VTAALQSSWKTISAALTFVDDDDDDDGTMVFQRSISEVVQVSGTIWNYGDK